jgi:RNA recognition motif-containing protein
MNIYVGNLTPQTSDEDLRTLFAEFGEVMSARVIKDRFSGEPRGFGFVEMPSKNDAINAIQGANGREMNGQLLTVNEARPRTENGGGNRGGGNRGGGNRW